MLGFLREAVDRLGQTVVMVTHDPGAAAHSDLVLYLADGRIVDRMERPTAEAVLERMRLFSGGNPHTPGSDAVRATLDGEGAPTGGGAGRSAGESIDLDKD